jgi:hypothetical protein
MLGMIRVLSSARCATMIKHRSGITDRLHFQDVEVPQLYAFCPFQPVADQVPVLICGYLEIDHFHVLVLDRQSGSILLEDSTGMVRTKGSTSVGRLLKRTGSTV